MVGTMNDELLTQMCDAAEMLWTVVANAGGGDWDKESKDWQEAAARWRDNYFAVLERIKSAPSSARSVAAARIEQTDLYASYANHCAIRGKVALTFHSWKRESQKRVHAMDPHDEVAWLIKRHSLCIGFCGRHFRWAP
jgi:hypothetical protein